MRESKQIKGRAVSVIFWGLLILWTVFIFCMSAQTGSESSGMSSPFAVKAASIVVPGYEKMTDDEQQAAASEIEVIIRKTAHFTEYAILGFLIYLVVQMYVSKRLISFFCAWGFSVLYAASDEIHQLFVSGRSGQIKDVCIDAAGACAGVLACIFILFILFLVKNKNERLVSAYKK